MQPKKLSKFQTGPRLIKCPVCKKMSAYIESKTTTAGTTHRRVVCYASECGSERRI